MKSNSLRFHVAFPNVEIGMRHQHNMRPPSVLESRGILRRKSLSMRNKLPLYIFRASVSDPTYLAARIVPVETTWWLQTISLYTFTLFSNMSFFIDYKYFVSAYPTQFIINGYFLKKKEYLFMYKCKFCCYILYL